MILAIPKKSISSACFSCRYDGMTLSLFRPGCCNSDREVQRAVRENRAETLLKELCSDARDYLREVNDGNIFGPFPNGATQSPSPSTVGSSNPVNFAFSSRSLKQAAVCCAQGKTSKPTSSVGVQCGHHRLVSPNRR